MRTTWTGRRQLERRPVAIKAQARFYDGAPPVDCEMTNYSASGARVGFPAGSEPAGAFDLFVPARGETLHAVPRWKTPGVVGVEFVKTKASTADQRLGDLLVRVSRIEDELRAVKAGTVLAQAGGAETPPAATPAPDPVPAVDPADHADLVQRVEKLEARNADLLHALKETLAMLGDLRDANAPGTKAA